jgi:membrane peptidoglycan carboxypeptidase
MSSRTARIIRHRRKQRLKSGGSAEKFGRVVGCTLIILFSFLLVSGVGTVGTGLAVWHFYAQQLPPADEMVAEQNQFFETTILYDRTGQIKIYEVIDPLGGDRQYVTLDQVPEYFLQATIAIEDASFYDNPGFDVQGMMRALWANVTSDQLQGGSTITQQLVKNVLIPLEERNDLSLDRKIKEVILSAELSRQYSKEQILEWYINSNFYGNLAYGIEAASQVYFDKSVRELTLAESALLAAIPQFPSQNPLDNPEAAQLRQRLVLRTMVLEGYITQAEMDAAMNETIVISPFARRFDSFSDTAPHFAIYARNEAEAILDTMGYDGAQMVSREGLRIITTLDFDVQQQLECVARSQISRLTGGGPNSSVNTSSGTPCVAADQFLRGLSNDILANNRTVTNASGIVLNSRTGEITAMLGSADFWNEGIDGNFNAAISLRQPASTFKPFVYVTSFFKLIDANTVITPATMTYDVRTEFNNGTGIPYVPENIDHDYHGPVSVREALARSYNIPAVEVINLVGLSDVLETAHQMGINTMNDGLSAYGLSLALGTAEASLLDMTYAYSVFNNNGVMVGTPVPPFQARDGYRQLNPVAVLRIETAEGEVLWEYGENQGTFDRRGVLEPGMAYMITDILSDADARVPAFPRGSVLELSRPAAVKTGTSDDFRDSWTIGYTPQYTVGVWVGNNNNTNMTDVTGLVGAAPIWNAIMEYIHISDGLPVEEWPVPSTIVEQSVCQISGMRPNSNCPTRSEIFFYDPTRNYDYTPQQIDTFWVEYAVNTCNNTLATPSTPPGCRSDTVYFDYPDRLLDWAIERNQPRPPETSDNAASGSIFDDVAIISPGNLEAVSGTVEIRGNVRDDNIDFYRIEFGAGATPSSWQQIGDNNTVEEGNRSDILLATWDTSVVPNNSYVIRLTLVRTDSTTQTATREVIVDNTPPTIRLTSPEPDRTYSASQDVFLEIIAEPSDLNIDYVDFYVDGELLERVVEGPYRYRWEIPQSGVSSATFQAIVSDRAGNQTASEQIPVQIEP